MKSIIVLFALIVISAGLTAKEEEKIKEFAKECRTSSGIEREKLEKLRNGDIEDDPKVKDFISCLFKKLSLQKSDGNIDQDIFKSKLSSKLTEAEKETIINDCINLKGSNDSETAFLLYKCYRSKTPSHNADLLV
uniref:Odorant-binding protein 13 n=2 Tax=Holotrichia TaxID=33393 RepID=A0A3S8S8U2_HOLOL